MTPAVITPGLIHQLTAGSHAEGITALDVAAAICHDARVLLIAGDGTDFTDGTWQLPAGPVLPGHTLTDALHPAVAPASTRVTPDCSSRQSSTPTDNRQPPATQNMISIVQRSAPQALQRDH